MLVLLRECQQDDWTNLPHQHVCVLRGSSAVLPCSLTPPVGHTVTNVFWQINAVKGVEPIDIAGEQSYTGRVVYYWDGKSHKDNCTLKLTNVSESDSAGYRARIITDQAKWQSSPAIQLSTTGDCCVLLQTFFMQCSPFFNLKKANEWCIV